MTITLSDEPIDIMSPDGQFVLQVSKKDGKWRCIRYRYLITDQFHVEDENDRRIADIR